LNGEAIDGLFSSRRLRRFFPREGTCLYEEQKAVEEWPEDEAQVEEGESRRRQGEVQETDEDGSGKAVAGVGGDEDVTFFEGGHMEQ
jgi:hypothetical protein